MIRPGFVEVVVDVETKNFAHEVGGWGNIAALGLSVAVTWSSRLACFEHYTEDRLPTLFDELFAADLVVGFNLKGFDYIVLQPYTDRDLLQLPTMDLMEEVYRGLNFRFRPKLDDLAAATLNTRKSGDGFKAVEMFRAGDMPGLKKYCQEDVAITRDLWQFAKEHGYLLCGSHGGLRRVAVGPTAHSGARP